jgi:hypothetical protein
LPALTATTPLLLAQVKHVGQSATRLEGAGALQQLQFELEN